MSTSTRKPEDDKDRLESLPSTFASLRSEIERMSAELQSLQSRFKQNLQQSLTDVALAVDEQLKEAVTAAEQVVRKQVLTELRGKYGTELELALTDRDRIDRRLGAVTKQLEDQNLSWTAKVADAERLLARLQADLQQAQAERLELETSLGGATEKLTEIGQQLNNLQAEARQSALDKQGLEDRLQQIEVKRSEAELALNQLQTDSRQLHSQKQAIEGSLQQSAEKLSKTEQSLSELQTQVRQLTIEKNEIEIKLQQSEAKRLEAERSAARLLSDTGHAQAGKKELETQLQEAQTYRSETEQIVLKLQADLKLMKEERQDVEARLAEASSHFTEMEQSVIRLRSELELEQAGKREVEGRLAESGAAAAQSGQLLAKLQIDLHGAQSEGQELETKLKQAMAAGKEVEARLQEAASKLSQTELALDKVQADSTQLQTEKQQLESKLAEATASRDDTENSLKEAADRFARAEESISSLRTEANAAVAARAELESQMREISTTRTELEAKLSGIQSMCAEFDEQLKQSASGRTALEQEILKLQADLQIARSQPPPPPVAEVISSAASLSLISPEKLELELARVEGTLAEVMSLIDDPAIALSTVMRKNLEKCELESYLKGIRFAIGKDQAKSPAGLETFSAKAYDVLEGRTAHPLQQRRNKEQPMRRPLLLTFVGLLASLFFLLPKSFSDGPPKDSEFVYARIRYHMTQYGAMMHEVAWHHDYPYSDETFPSVLAEVTNIRSSNTSYQVVDIDSPEIFKYPFAYLCEPGFINLLPKDVVNLREWLDRGGFLLVDDLRTAADGRYIPGGEDDLNHFRTEMKKMYPDREFVHLDLSDPIFNTFYKIDTLGMTAPYFFYGQGPVEFLGLRDGHGNLQMILNNNNDISEFWEWLDEGRRSMHDAATSFHFGINDVMYAMTH